MSHEAAEVTATIALREQISMMVSTKTNARENHAQVKN